MASQYDFACICKNGHIINEACQLSPADTTEFCSLCGVSVISQCAECGSKIRGASLYNSWGGDWCVGQSLARPPGYCSSCGKPYPWTSLSIEAAHELISEMEELSDLEKDSLKSTLPDLICDSPKTEISAARYKKLIKKAAESSKRGLEKILWVVVTESVKKLLSAN